MPEALGDALDETAFHDLPSAVAFAVFFEGGGDGFGVFGAGPVDLDGEAVVAVGEVAGTPSGGFKDGGATEAPVGDEEGALGFEGVDFDVSVGDGDALEIVEADVADLEGEEGGDGLGHGVAEV